MAKKDELAAIPRLISKVIPPCTITATTGPAAWTVIGEGWKIRDTNNSTMKVAYWDGYIDLSGYEREELTFFVTNSNVVENQAPQGSHKDNYGMINDFMTKRIIDVDEINRAYDRATLMYSPGFNDSVCEMDEVLYARNRLFAAYDGTAPNMQLLANNQWGQGEATAGTRIYLTRLVDCSNSLKTAGTLQVPASCYQLIGVPMQEPDLTYIMRLRRDYELQSQVGL